MNHKCNYCHRKVEINGNRTETYWTVFQNGVENFYHDNCWISVENKWRLLDHQKKNSGKKNHPRIRNF